MCPLSWVTGVDDHDLGVLVAEAAVNSLVPLMTGPCDL